MTLKRKSGTAYTAENYEGSNMISTILAKLREASEELDKEITSASRALRTGDKDRCQYARIKIQEAITRLLEVSL